MAVEAAASRCSGSAEPFEYRISDEVHTEGVPARLHIEPMIRQLTEGRLAGAAVELLAARFHETIARMLADAANRACAARDVNTVALSGGCFCNRLLLGRTIELLESAGRQVLYHRAVPPGDGGLALGQACVAAWRAGRRHAEAPQPTH